MWYNSLPELCASGCSLVAGQEATLRAVRSFTLCYLNITFERCYDVIVTIF
jgi:hypothetical protein